MKRNPDLERYLKLATWGVSGQARTTLKLELESHVMHKAWKYEMSGLNENAAITKALEDLGQPLKISAGMTEVYAMPQIIRSAILTALLMMLGVTSFNSSAQITVTNQFPIEPCLKTKNTNKNLITVCTNSDLWLRIADLKAILEPQGVKYKKTATSYFGQSKSYSWNFVFPGSSKPVYPLGITGTSSFKISKDYLDAVGFIRGLPSTDLPVSMTGWSAPKIRVGKTQFTLGTPQKPIDTQTFYNRFISDELFRLFPKIRSVQLSGNAIDTYTGFRYFNRQRINVVGVPESVYALLHLEQGSSGVSLFAIVVPLSSNGVLDFNVQNNGFKLVKSFADLPIESPFHSFTVKNNDIKTTLLVRLNSNLSDLNHRLEFIDPNSVLVQPSEPFIANNTTPTSFCEGKGGVNSSLQGKWIGELTTNFTSDFKEISRISSNVSANGIWESTITNLKNGQKEILVTGVCNDGSLLGFYRNVYENTRGKIIVQSDGTIKGSSEERSDRFFSKSTFRLKRQ